MLEEQKFKRHIAYKFRIGDLLFGKPIMNEERFSFLELGNKKIIRINLVGNIVDKYEREDERKYISLTLDDGSGQIRLKSFGDDADKFKDIHQGQTVIVIGVLRHWNDETYVSPEIIKELDPKYLLVRKLETEKEKILNSAPVAKEQIVAIKDKVLDMIKGSEEEEIGTDQIIANMQNISPEIINQEIKKLLEEGIIFEPRPGKVRYLG